MTGDACVACGGALAEDQRYCLNCGKRVGSLRVPAPQAATAGRPAQRQPSLLRLPAPRSAGAMAVLTLGFGVFIGLALGPAFTSDLLAGGRWVLELPPGGDEGAPAATGDVSAALEDPIGNVSAAGGSGGAPAKAGASKTAPAGTDQPPPESPSPPNPPRDGDRPGPGPGPPGLPPGPPDKTIVEGTVVHVNPVAKSYSVATADGVLVPIHATDPPDPRTNVTVEVQDLFNGSFAERGERTTDGSSAQATMAGTVTYLDPDAGTYTVSVTGASVLVHAATGGAGPPELPELATDVSVDVTIELPPASTQSSRVTGAVDGCDGQPQPGPAPAAVLRERDIVVQGLPVGSIDLAGIVQRACDSSHELTLSADDIRASASDIQLTAPEAIDLTRLELGKSVNATVRIEDDGSYTLSGVSSDDGKAGADDSSSGQGDQAAE